MMNINVNPMVYRDAILSFLKEKYGEEFTVIKLFQEFEGRTGMAVRALCAVKGNRDYFSVYCYFDPSIADEEITIDNHKHSISDAFIGIRLQNRLLDELAVTDMPNGIVKCRVVFDPQPPRHACANEQTAVLLRDATWDPYVAFYVIAENGTSVDEVQSKMVSILEAYKPCTGYIYLAYVDAYDPENILSIYDEKQLDFGNYLANTDFAKRLDFVLYKNDTGLQTKKVIKE